MTETRTGDIVDLLSQDHEEAKQLLEEITGAAPGARKELFWELVPALVRHEVAEEVVVYPTIRSEAPDGDAEVEPRLKEQQQAEEMLASMENLDPESDEFRPKAEPAPRRRARTPPGGGAAHLPASAGTRTRGGAAQLGARYEKAKASPADASPPQRSRHPSG